jgi:Domain of unknown function (DUF4911)
MLSQPGDTRTIQRLYRVDRRRINLIKFVFEAYEGLAVVTTLDPETGLIALRIAPGCEKMAQEIIMGFGVDFLVEAVATAPEISGKSTV